MLKRKYLLKSVLGTGLLISFLTKSSFAQSAVNITGKVVDSTGTGIPGVTVTLKKNNLSTTTAADGTYHLTGTTALYETPQMQVATPIFKNQNLEFEISNDHSLVKIGIFNLNGKVLQSMVESELKAGNYSLRPTLADTKNRVCILTIQIGQVHYAFKMFNTEGNFTDTHLINQNTKSVLNKIASTSTSDSVVVMKAGFNTDAKSVESYTGVYNFMLINPNAFWGNINAYPVATQVMTYVFLNRTHGVYRDDQIYWTFNNQTKTLAQQSTFDMPANSSGRVTFHLGDAASKYWDFMEHTINARGWFGNTTRVDAWGLPIAMRVIGQGQDELLGEKYEVFYLGRAKFFQTFKDAVPTEFTHCATNGEPYRIIAPGKGDGGFGPKQAFGTYFDAYLKQLGITTATTEQAFNNSGTPFGSDAQIAGAVNRHVAHLPKTDWSNRDLYYKQSPANYYAKFLHDYSFQGKSYGFAYDDSQGNAAYTEVAKPKTLIIAIGF